MLLYWPLSIMLCSRNLGNILIIGVRYDGTYYSRTLKKKIQHPDIFFVVYPSYYETEDTSVVFEIPLGTGRIIYLGYDYSEPITPWVHALVAATMFNDYDFEGTPRREMKQSAGRWA